MLRKRYLGNYQLKMIFSSYLLLREDGQAAELPVTDAGASAAQKALLFGQLADALFEKDDFKGAIPGLKAGLAASPDDFPQFRQALAYAYVRLGMLDEAEPL